MPSIYTFLFDLPTVQRVQDEFMAILALPRKEGQKQKKKVQDRFCTGATCAELIVNWFRKCRPN